MSKTIKTSTPRPVGKTGLEVTALGIGSAPLGGLYAPVTTADAVDMLQAAWAAGIRYFDTAPMYGNGRSEHLVGQVLRETGEKSFVLSTKVGRLMTTERAGRKLPPAPPKNPLDPGWWNGLPFREVFDYSYDGVMRSFDDSQQRLGFSNPDILYVHDIGRVTHADLHDHHWTALTKGGGFKALTELRAAGDIKGFGLGVNEWQAIRDALDEADLDCSMLAGRYTLLDQDAERDFLPLVQKRGMALVVAGVYNSGILASTSAKPKFNYADAPVEIIEKADRLRTICNRFEVPLPAAAIQFPMRHPATTCVVIGAKTAAQLNGNVAWFNQDIPEELWTTLETEGLIGA
ncbi:aldo/keto reductase [Rhizobium skierniewicense]|uniref:aldo/keto reductase n=1 Tax=Rhizobium skierniewicense TaxID=984260 RepID=UPI001571BBE6|nr:aldo/keto reductase [Rhizobium skierniewicense]NTF33425.1 aldo/keto reductase [Rhizobium skierniewicense]